MEVLLYRALDKRGIQIYSFFLFFHKNMFKVIHICTHNICFYREKILTLKV